MRINRDTLIKIAEDTVSQRTKADRSLISVYLCGSMMEPEYLLGGTTDVDLVFLHIDTEQAHREIVPLSDEVHIDIAHHVQEDYRQPRTLRIHPWMGPTIKEARILYDPQHFMDFTQAGVRGQYHRPDYVFQRALNQAEHARQIWMEFQTKRPPAPGPKEVFDYLRALSHAANTIASICGPPLTERRFLLNFPKRAQEIGRPGMYAGLLGLLGAPNVELNQIAGWIPQWEDAYRIIPPDETPARLHPARRLYYQKAFESILGGVEPKAVLWPLLRTWTLAVKLLHKDAPQRSDWDRALEGLGLQGEGFEERIKALDIFLDLIDETLEEWARKNGVWVE
jgi:hypothetical protein